MACVCVCCADGCITSHCGTNGTHVICIGGEPRHGKPPRYRRHLGCILLKISAISLSTGWLGGTSYTHSKRATQPILTPKSAWVLFLGWVLCNVVIVLSESGNADECGVTLQRHSTATD